MDSRTHGSKAKTNRLFARNGPTFSVSATEEDIKMMDARARAQSLGLTRSAYLIALARQDCYKTPEFVMVPKEKLVIPP